jgi:uncharacterized membrane protein
MTDATVVREADSSLITTLHVTYALHAVGLAIGAFGASTVVGGFIFGWPSIIAVIINYVKRGDARGTWLESHFAWQITTFWIAVGLSILIAAVSAILVLVVIGFLTWPMGFFVLGIWAIYRIAKGWLRLQSSQAIT